MFYGKNPTYHRDFVYPLSYCVCVCIFLCTHLYFIHIYIYTHYYKLIFFTVTVNRQHSRCSKSFNRGRHLVVNLYFFFLFCTLSSFVYTISFIIESITFSFALFVYRFTERYYSPYSSVVCITVYYDKIMTI